MVLPFTCLFGALKQSAAVDQQVRGPKEFQLASGQSLRKDVALIEPADLIRISLRMPEAFGRAAERNSPFSLGEGRLFGEDWRFRSCDLKAVEGLRFIGGAEEGRTPGLRIANRTTGKNVSICLFESCSHQEILRVFLFFPISYHWLPVASWFFCPRIGHLGFHQ
jgi:hypothetical protein